MYCSIGSGMLLPPYCFYWYAISTVWPDDISLMTTVSWMYSIISNRVDSTMADITNKIKPSVMLCFISLVSSIRRMPRGGCGGGSISFMDQLLLSGSHDSIAGLIFYFLLTGGDDVGGCD